MKLALLVLFLLSSPAWAANVTDVAKTPACEAGAPVQIIRPEPDVIVINYFMAQAQRKIWLRNYYCSRPCDLKGRIRSKADCNCYKPERLP